MTRFHGFILSRDFQTSSHSQAELGCGACPFPSIVACLCGAKVVHATDGVDSVVAQAKDNISA